MGISTLRKVLGESPQDHRYIVTVPGRGYRFVAGVRDVLDQGGELIQEEHSRIVIEQTEVYGEPESGGGRREEVRPRKTLSVRISRPGLIGPGLSVLLIGLLGAGWWIWKGNRDQAPGGDLGVRTLAVLPFMSFSSDQGNEYLGLGLADTLITKLSNLPELIVRPTSAVRRYTVHDQDSLAAGREQQVEAVLEGTIQRSGDQIRVSVRLLDVRDGRPLWAYQCDEQQCTDLFAMQDAISEQVARALMLELTGTDRAQLAKHYTENREAYDAYMKGRYAWNQRTPAGIERAIQYYERAIAMDRNYALAYAGLADTFIQVHMRRPALPARSRHALARAKEAVNRALELDDSLAEAHVSAARIEFTFDWNWSAAEIEFQRALELKSNFPPAHYYYAAYLATMGRHEQALAEAERARILDPLSPVTNNFRGLVLYSSGQNGRAIEQLKRSVELEPTFPDARLGLGRCYLKQRQYQAAVVEFKKGMEFGGGPDEKASLAFASALAGERAEAINLLDEFLALSETEAVALHVALVYSGLNERERALEWLVKAYVERTPTVLWLRLNDDPYWDSLRSDPRFVSLLQRMKLHP